MQEFEHLKFIKNNENKIIRYYDERYYPADDIFFIEMFFYFKNAFENNYNVYVIETKPNRNLVASESDLEFMNTIFDREVVMTDEVKPVSYFKNFKYSDNLQKYKNEIFKDLKIFYELMFGSRYIRDLPDNIGSIFVHPMITENLIHWTFIIISKPKFDINKIWKHHFNLFNISSIIQKFEWTLDRSFFEKYFIMEKFTFKNNYKDTQNFDHLLLWTYKEIRDQSQESDLFDKISQIRDEIRDKKKLLEKIISENKIDKILENEINELSKKKDDLRKIVYCVIKSHHVKYKELINLDIAAEFYFNNFFFQFHCVDSALFKDATFSTNFYQRAGTVINLDSGENLIDNELIMYMGYSDLIHNNDAEMCSYFQDWRYFKYFSYDKN